jgi:hypothetical protein
LIYPSRHLKTLRSEQAVLLVRFDRDKITSELFGNDRCRSAAGKRIENEITGFVLARIIFARSFSGFCVG